MTDFEKVSAKVKVYWKSHDSDSLKEILGETGLLDAVDQSAIIARLAELANVHGMTKRELVGAMKDLSRLVGSEGLDNFYHENKYQPQMMADYLANTCDYLHTYKDGKLRLYRNGVYVDDTYLETEASIRDLLGASVTPKRKSDAIELLKHDTVGDIPIHKHWVNLKSSNKDKGKYGRLCLTTFELLEHGPAFKSIIQLPVEYDANASCPVFDGWLSDVLPNTADQMLLLQLIGYSMLQDVRFGKIVVLYGPTHTGKSTCLEVVKAFLGVDNVSAISLHALDNEDLRFARYGLVGKLANISADLSHRHLKGDSQIKQIASGDSMMVEPKNLASFLFEPFATLWNSSNQLPVSNDRSDAWYERLVILPFTCQHKGESADRGLVSKMTNASELSGILNRVLPALRILLKENQFRTTESTDAMLDEYRLENDQVSRFLSDYCVKDNDGEILENALYENYVQWAEDEGISRGLSKLKFRAGVKGWGAKHVRAGNDGNRAFVYRGIAESF